MRRRPQRVNSDAEKRAERPKRKSRPERAEEEECWQAKAPAPPRAAHARLQQDHSLTVVAPIRAATVRERFPGRVAPLPANNALALEAAP